MIVHGHGRRRAGTDTGAATTAQRLVDLRLWNTTGRRTETYGACLTLLAAAAAYDTMGSKTALTDGRPQLPGHLIVMFTQRAARTLFETGAAEGAFTTQEIDLGETAAPGTEQAMGAGAYALVAAITAFDEQPLLQRPGRAHGTPLAAYVTAEELRSSDRRLHHAAPRVNYFVVICV